MRIDASPEALRLIRDRGGMLFVCIRKTANLRAAVRVLVASTDPPGTDALDYQRFEAHGVLIFLPPGIRPPRELRLQVHGRFRRRVQAFWNGCYFVPDIGLA